jgi:Type VI secretion system (T6SS), amidase effector protein 4
LTLRVVIITVSTMRTILIVLVTVAIAILAGGCRMTPDGAGGQDARPVGSAAAQPQDGNQVLVDTTAIAKSPSVVLGWHPLSPTALGYGVDPIDVTSGKLSPFTDESMDSEFQVDGGPPETRLMVSVSQSAKERYQASKKNINVEMKFFSVRGRASHESSSSTSAGEGDVTIHMVMQTDFGRWRMRHCTLSDEAGSLLASAVNRDLFLERYGTHFVVAERRGAFAEAAITFHCGSSSEAKKLRNALELKAKFFFASGKIDASYESTLKEKTANKTYQVNFTAHGGPGPAALKELIAAADSGDLGADPVTQLKAIVAANIKALSEYCGKITPENAVTTEHFCAPFSMLRARLPEPIDINQRLEGVAEATSIAFDAHQASLSENPPERFEGLQYLALLQDRFDLKSGRLVLPRDNQAGLMQAMREGDAGGIAANRFVQRLARTHPEVLGLGALPDAEPEAGTLGGLSLLPFTAKKPDVATLWSQYPAGKTPQEVVDDIGGKVKANYKPDTIYGNTCAIRVSRALNLGGWDIDKAVAKTANARWNSGGDKKAYVYAVSDLSGYLTAMYGAPTSFPTNAKKADLAGKQGIIAFGEHHIALWNGTDVLEGDYFGSAEIKHPILLWELPPTAE